MEHHVDMLNAACTAIGQIGDPKSLNALEWAITHPTPVVRVAAAQALLQHGKPGMDMLLSKTQDANGGDAASEVLARHTIKKSVDLEIDLTPVQLEFRFH
jgi:HEAT repeat protein